MMKTLDDPRKALQHDLRSPLAAIQGYARLLLGSPEAELGPRQRSFVESIVAACRVQAHLFENMLLMERLEHDVVAIDETRGHLPEILKRVSAELDRAFRSKGARLIAMADDAAIPRGAAIVECIAANLLLAALRTSDADSEVHIHAEHRDGMLTLRLDAPGTEGPGMGGGLALIEELVRRIGGHCRFTAGRLEVIVPETGLSG